MKNFIEKAFIRITFDTKEEVLKKIENLLNDNPGSLRLYGSLRSLDIDIDINIENPTMELVKLPDCYCFYGILTLEIRKGTC